MHDLDLLEAVDRRIGANRLDALALRIDADHRTVGAGHQSGDERVQADVRPDVVEHAAGSERAPDRLLNLRLVAAPQHVVRLG
jgi:hypothetical protein